MKTTRLFGQIMLMAALGAATLTTPTPASAHPSPAHTINGSGMAGANPVTVLSANQLTDTGVVLIGSTTVALSCVEVIPSGPTTHLAGMYGTGGGLAWTITIRQSSAGDYLIVNNAPWAPPTNANMCGIGNVGATGLGAFTII